MTYTILSACYANDDHTAAVMMTAEAAAVLVSIDDTPDMWVLLHDWGEPEAYAAPPAPPKTWGSATEFMEEFTFDERVALRQLAKEDPVVEDFLDLLRGVNFVSASDQRTLDGLAYVTSKGTISQARVDQILSA